MKKSTFSISWVILIITLLLESFAEIFERPSIVQYQLVKP